MQHGVFSWLGKSAPNDKYEDSLAKRVDTTCEWILERPAFKSWLSPVDSAKPSVLWINGPAGFGKTVLCAHIVHHLTESLDKAVAHFFFTSDHESRDDPFTALRSWQRQVAIKSNDAFECIRRAWENDSSDTASRRTLVNLFKQIIAVVPGCIFIADGLDECSQLGEGEASVARFLRDIMGAMAGTNVNVRLLLISRDEPEVREALMDYEEALSEYKVGTDDVQADTAALSQSVVDRKLCGKSKDLRLAISKSMTDKCQGQFLWIKLQEQSLRNTMSKKRLYEVVANTPSGLDRLYDQNWSRIMNMSDQDRDRAFVLLRWTAFALGPLSVYTVVEAVLMDQFEELNLDDYPESVNDEYVTREILGICGPLVEVHNNKQSPFVGWQTLHMPHFSVRQYLIGHLPAPIWMQPKDVINMEREKIHHTAIARVCVQYLSLPQIWEAGHDPNYDLYPIPKGLYIYAAFNWTQHAKLGFMDQSLRDISKELLKSNNICFKSLVNYLAKHHSSITASQTIFQPQLRPFDYLCYGGWIKMANLLIDDVDVNEIGPLGRSPIFSASISGSAETVKMLISRGADLSITDVHGTTCLHEAAGRGFEDIVRLLVESKVNLSSPNRFGRTPLHVAAARGHLRCYQYLIGKGADCMTRDTDGFSSVHHASFFPGNSEVLRYILQHGPGSLATDHENGVYPPLMHVAHVGDVDMAKVLFEFGAVSSLSLPTSPYGELPLQPAVYLGHVELVELFLEHGAESTLSMPNRHGDTPLHLACVGTGRDKIISLLLQPGVETSILMQNKRGDTPLHVASGKGHASYAKLILQYSVPQHQHLLEMQNKRLETPLFLASSLGNVTVVRELLKFGAQTNLSVSDERRRTPLLVAAEKGHVDVVKALLAHGAESTIHLFDCDNSSPLLMASVRGFSEIVKELLSYGAGKTITASDDEGEAPLHAAAIGGHVEVLKLILEVPGVPVNQKTPHGFSPLCIASRNGYHNMVELLLSIASIDKDSENWLGLGPLFAAVANGHLEVTKLLLSKGCHVQPRVSIGRDLLWWAQRSNKPDLIQLLKSQEALRGTPSGSCSSPSGPFTLVEPLPRYAETIDCKPGVSWCYVCTLSFQDGHAFHCVECGDLFNFVCSECFTRGFKLCQRLHFLVPLLSDHSSSSSSSSSSDRSVKYLDL